MTLKTLNPDEVKKLQKLIDEGVGVHQDIKDLREGLTETVKAVAEEVDIKPTIISKAIRHAFKGNLAESQEELSEAEEILEVTKRR